MINNKKEFLDKAVYLASNKIFLNEVREKIRNYFDENYNRDLCGLVSGCAEVFSTVWKRWCAQERLSGLSISANSIDYIKKSLLN